MAQLQELGEDNMDKINYMTGGAKWEQTSDDDLLTERSQLGPDEIAELSPAERKELVAYLRLQAETDGSSCYDLGEVKHLPDPGNEYYHIGAPIKFMTHAEYCHLRKYIFDTFRVLRVQDMTSIPFGDGGKKSEIEHSVDLLVTGKSNKKFKDVKEVEYYNSESGASINIPISDINPLKRIDAAYYNNVLDPAFEYFSLEEAAEEIRVGVKPPKPSKDSHGYQIMMLGPENINEIGEIIGDYMLTVPEVPKSFSRNCLEVGDVLIVAFGGHLRKNKLGSIGYGALVDNRFPKDVSYANHYMFKVKLKKQYDPYYIVVALREEYVRQQIRRLVKANGKNQFILPKEAIKELRFRKLDNMTEIGRQYKEAIDQRRRAYETIIRIRG